MPHLGLCLEDLKTLTYEMLLGRAYTCINQDDYLKTGTGYAGRLEFHRRRTTDPSLVLLVVIWPRIDGSFCLYT
jgi:hypothetical protein